MTKKIAVLNPYVPTLGGGEKHMGYMCKFMEKYYDYDVKIDVIVHDYNDIKVTDEDYITVDDINKQFGLDLRCTQIVAIEQKPGRSLFERKWNRKLIKDTMKQYDILVNFKFQSNDVGNAKVNLYGCMFPIKRMFVTSRKLLKPISIFRDYRFYNSYQTFIANSQYTYKWIGRYWKEDDKNCVIYPPVFSKAEIEGRYNESKKKNIIISVGRFFVGGHCKKQVDMVKFFVDNNEKFRNYEYHLVGAVSNDVNDLRYLDKVKRLASQVDNIFVHDNCPFSELLELYGKAKIFWHGTGYGADDERQPQNMEHFGITTVEAMSFGAVPVVIRRGGQTETVEEGVNGFLWESEKECIEKTMRLIEDDNLRMQLAEVASERANDYSIETFYERNEALFHELQI